MARNDVFLRQVQYKGTPTGEKYADGKGLYFHVTSVGKYWRLSYRYAGKQKTLYIGVYPDVSLALARRRMEAARESLAEGDDLGVLKREAKTDKLLEASNTFEGLARLWLSKMAGTRTAKTQSKASNWMEHDVYPYIGKLPVASIRPRDILRVVQRVEARGAIDSSHRIKQVCGQIFRFGVAMNLLERDVTVDLKGALAPVPRGHYAALTEPKDVALLMRRIYDYEGHVTGEAALKLAPLLLVRPDELRYAEWAEINLDAAEWRIPARKMKMKIEHIVPLSMQAVAFLRDLHRSTGEGSFVFPNLRSADACMSENTINAALRGMGYPKTVMMGHGLRAMARTILDEVLEERVDLIEHQLAHSVIDVNGRAYNRTAHLPVRRVMMQRWADYLDGLRTDLPGTSPAES